MSQTASQRFEQHFIDLIAPGVDPQIERVLRDLVRATRRQHTCIDLSDKPQALLDLLRSLDIVSTPGSAAPLVMHGSKLFFAKYYQMEADVATRFRHLNATLDEPPTAWLQTALLSHFGEDLRDRQRLAALLALTRRLTIISGGPGTGKTSTVARILELLTARTPELVIKLAAPTGKAAMRLNESLNDGHGAEPYNVTTIHRLLGMRADGRSFRHDRYNPVQADVLVVDEASMIDLRLMHRLLEALPTDIRLILLGDPDQLPSVDSGNVLADLCASDPVFTETFVTQYRDLVDLSAAHTAHHGLSNAICHLDRNFRFTEDSAVGRLAARTRRGDAAFEGSNNNEVGIEPTLDLSTANEALLAPWTPYFTLLKSGRAAPHELLASFNKARILTSYRGGPTGVVAINRFIEEVLATRGLRNTDDEFYPGRPVMVLRNEYRLDIYNGDVGICVPGSGADLIAFPGQDPLKPRLLAASRLPEHETCFAMTVHKSQGSEFDHISLILNEREQDDELISRELVYTAITRARRSVTLHGNKTDWEDALANRATRISGMAEFLSED